MMSPQRDGWVAVLALSLAGVATGVGFAAQQVPAGDKPPAPQVAVERMGMCFDLLSPEARLQLLDKIPDAGQAFQPAARGDVVLTVRARGSVESARNNDIYCVVKSGTKGSPVATTIRWIVDDGSKVKKGDLILLLDDTHLLEQMKNAKKGLLKALAEKVSAANDLKLERLTGRQQVLAGEIEVLKAKSDLEKYDGKDADKTKFLELKLETAYKKLGATQSVVKTREAKSLSDFQAKSGVVESEMVHTAEIELQIKECRIIAPQDGTVIYYLSGGRHQASQLLAPGEPVREGQKLLQIPDLAKMVVDVRVSKAQATLLSNRKDDKEVLGQVAQIKVDAFPKRVLKGHVKFVNPVAFSGSSFTVQELEFPTRIAIDEPLKGLRPGLSAEVQIEACRKNGVVKVPLQSVVLAGKDHYCYVRVGQAIQKRRVTPGLQNDAVVEIQKGLHEGEAVLGDPHDLLRRLRDFLNAPAKSQEP